MMEKITVMKIGGNVIDNPEALKAFLAEFATVEGPKILVHGGGKLATRLAERLELQVQMVDGRRITDKGTLDVVTMVYAGLINKQIVASLQKIGCNALGLCGADGDCVPATKRKASSIDWGFVGDVDPKKINVSLLHSLLAKGITPVFCAITHDGNGSLLNTNADTMASSIAVALASEYYVRLIYCFEKDGVLSDPNDNDSLIPLITQNSYSQLLDEGKVVDGMIPKLDNAFLALREGVAEVIIKHADNLLNDRETLLKL